MGQKHVEVVLDVEHQLQEKAKFWRGEWCSLARDEVIRGSGESLKRGTAEGLALYLKVLSVDVLFSLK